MWRSGKERVTARSSESRRSSASHRMFWKVPPGAPQPSSFVSEPRRVTRRKSRPFRRCLLPRLPGQQRGGAGAELGFAERRSGGGSKLRFLALLELSGAHSSTGSAREYRSVRREPELSRAVAIPSKLGIFKSVGWPPGPVKTRWNRTECGTSVSQNKALQHLHPADSSLASFGLSYSLVLLPLSA